jgi:hypothetical protein
MFVNAAILMMTALCCVAIVVVERATKTFCALDAASCIACARQWNDQPVAQPLVISFGMHFYVAYLSPMGFR